MSDNVFKLAKALKELEALRSKTVDLSKALWAEVKAGLAPDFTSYLELIQKLDEVTRAEGARAIGHFALTVALDAYKMVKELRDEQKEMRRRMEEINENAIRNKPDTVPTEERTI